MNSRVIITGPSLAADAVSTLEAAGLSPVFVDAYSSGEELVAAVRRADPVAIISRMGKIDGAVLNAAPHLKVISKHGVGVDNIDIQLAGEKGIPVLVASGANAVSVAEHAMALLLAVAKRLPALDAGVREGRWEKPGFSGRELAGSTLGMVAFGAIARRFAKYAQSFDIRVLAFDPFCPAHEFVASGVERVGSLEELLSASDAISLHCPLTAETRHLINADSIGLMKRDAILINTARGGLIDESALVDALDAGRLAGAGLDTFAQEPPPGDHAFWSQRNLVLTPHIGGVTRAANIRVGQQAAQGVVDFLLGKAIEPGRIVNADSLSVRDEMRSAATS
ncbi:hydroxyacid dehydrogenase [Arsenicitalea aurantiaca]|uniref:Hydroxyacid dehydrogenase n=1 Tax=Arsenicitalea aurantiaca TaxID=1783274 RepID=A0A433X2I4_9HYPH|nr:hydroxyacid dehydrogenase [Arsenicitalea aurantiaca]RUT28304.1 hydroxyacid dehydrogenase [Arsenicitalea aurantiaca]